MAFYSAITVHFTISFLFFIPISAFHYAVTVSFFTNFSFLYLYLFNLLNNVALPVPLYPAEEYYEYYGPNETNIIASPGVPLVPISDPNPLILPPLSIIGSTQTCFNT